MFHNSTFRKIICFCFVIICESNFVINGLDVIFSSLENFCSCIYSQCYTCDILTGTHHTVFLFFCFIAQNIKLSVSLKWDFSQTAKNKVESTRDDPRQALMYFIYVCFRWLQYWQSCLELCGLIWPQPWGPLKEWCHSFLLLLNHGLMLWIYRIARLRTLSLGATTLKTLLFVFIGTIATHCVCLCVCDTPAINLSVNAAIGQCLAPGGATDILSSFISNIFVLK